MAYGNGLLNVIRNFSESGILKAGASVLEIGAQEINPDVSVEAIDNFCGIAPGKVSPAEMLAMPGKTIGRLYSMLGFRYCTIDAFAADFCVQMDLNTDNLDPALVGNFDLVTNLGTTEHIANQYQVFKVIHESLKLGGYAFHQVPFSGYINHGLIKYEPKFFASLIRNNRYKGIYCSFTEPHWMQLERHETTSGIKNTDMWKDYDFPSGLINVVIQKVHDTPYAAPSDIDARQTGDVWRIAFGHESSSA